MDFVKKTSLKQTKLSKQDKHWNEIQKRYQELSQNLSQPNLDFGSEEYLVCVREHKDLEKGVQLKEEEKKISEEIEKINSLLEEDEWKELALEEMKNLESTREKIHQKIEAWFHSEDEDDKQYNKVIMEIRAGTGGDEASLFSADLFRSYLRYAERKNWKVELLYSNSTEGGGYKEVIFSLEGESVYHFLKFERGIHRVQRIPVTESGGRIHTSASTVAVLPEVEASEIEILPEDLRIDVYRSSGPGGQSVNTTDSAVRILHVPTGTVVQCQDEKSQHKNKERAMRVLRARLKEKASEKKRQERDQERREQIGSGDRSERIRTYNFPQNRITDHRIQLTLYNRLEELLDGNFDLVISPLQDFEKN